MYLGKTLKRTTTPALHLVVNSAIVGLAPGLSCEILLHEDGHFILHIFRSRVRPHVPMLAPYSRGEAKL
jgi:hypothetical protein